MKAHTPILCLILAVTGCLGGDDLAAGSITSELSSAANPTDHGALAFASPHAAALSSTDGFHAWQLTVAQSVDVTFVTAPVAGGPAVNTVLVLYRQQAGGSWGSSIARNDNGPTPPWSQLTLALTPGTYRILVRGATRSATGPFTVTASCSGAGCPSTCAPLALTPVDASALSPSIAAFNAGARNGFDWCSLSAASQYSTPTCPGQPNSLADVVDQVTAIDQNLGGFTFADGTVLTAAEIAQSLPFGTSCSQGGPGVAQAVTSTVSSQAPEGWLLTSEVPCHNCHEFNHYLVLSYPDGAVLVLPYVTGFDS